MTATAGEPAPPEARAMGLLNDARRQARLGQLELARVTLSQVVALLADAATLPRWRVRLSLVQCSLRFFADDTDGALDQIRQAHALACAHGLRPLQAACASAGSVYLQYLDQVDECVAWAEEALCLADPGDHETRYRAILSVATMCQEYGDGTRAFALYRAAMGHARTLGDTLGTAATVSRMILVQGREVMSDWLHGRLAAEALKQAIVGLQSGIALCDQEGFTPDFTLDVTLGELLVLQGDHLQAADMLRPWSDAEQMADAPFLPSRVAALMGQCALAAGDIAAARARLAQSDARWPPAWPEGFTLLRALSLAQRAVLQDRLAEPTGHTRAELQEVLRELDDEQAARREQLQRAITASSLEALVAA